ncbi:MAG: M20/M25/M40 family metallo-hydrolase [Acidobacteriota bacterium]
MKVLPRSSAPYRFLTTCFILFFLAGFAGSPLLPPNLDDVSVVQLKRHLSFLASAELGGRYTLSAGNRIAARYLATQLEAFGYRGAATDGSFFQKIPFVTRTGGQDSTLTLEGASKPFVHGEDFILRDPTATLPNLSLEADVIFVGYGASQPKSDAYKTVNAEGCIVLCLASGTPDALAGENLPSNWREQAALEHGAQAMLLIPDENLAEGWAQAAAYARRRSTPRVRPKSSPTPDQPVLPTFLLSPAAAEAFLAKFNLTLAQVHKAASVGAPLPSIVAPCRCTIRTTENERVEYSQNVVGILDGYDPKLKHEYVVLSAHYDHLPSQGDVIFPGADDDGSGTAAVLELARLFAEGKRLKRSILILFNTGEEMGLLGSGYFTDQEPLVPLEAIVANFNIDMIGRSRLPGDNRPENAELTDRNSVFLIGPDKHSRQLFELSEQTNATTVQLRLDYTYNEESHPLRLFYRSDHWNFAKRGIPIIFYFTGLHADYHRPTDTVDKIDFEKMVRITKLVYATAWRTADREQRFDLDVWKSKERTTPN